VGQRAAHARVGGGPTARCCHGFRQVLNENVTKGAVQARELDAPRVDAFVQSLADKFFVFRMLGRQATCTKASELLIKNFYRHPGTALFNTMVSGHDSYCRHVYQKQHNGGRAMRSNKKARIA